MLGWSTEEQVMGTPHTPFVQKATLAHPRSERGSDRLMPLELI